MINFAMTDLETREREFRANIRHRLSLWLDAAEDNLPNIVEKLEVYSEISNRFDSTIMDGGVAVVGVDDVYDCGVVG